MPTRYETVRIIDSHTGGEPTRLVYEGFPDLGNGSMAERLDVLKAHHDHWRRAVMLEPRGNDVLVGALLCEPVDPRAAAGVIFFNNSGYLGMCGHGTIGLMESLLYLGKIGVGTHIIETPVGNVIATTHEDGSHSFENVRSYRYRRNVSVNVAELGTLEGDVAWGGNWFFLVSGHGQTISLANAGHLTAMTQSIKTALARQGIRGKDGAEIDHIELFQPCDTADSQSFVLCPGGAYDRSPCGTGTSAKLACLAAENALAPGEEWRQASVIGSVFRASYRPADEGGIIPTIRGNAYLCGKAELLIDPDDPFKWGIGALPVTHEAAQ